ncbi:MAG: hypothetical protein ABFD82_06005 [Syntrophaceae bacterium]
MNKNDLLILETLKEAQLMMELLLAGDTRLKNCDILSLNPNIRAYLQEHRLESFSTVDFMDSHAFRSIMDGCEELENRILSDLKEWGIKDLRGYFVNACWHFLRLVWRHFLWNIELFDRCVNARSYKHVYAFKYGRIVTHSPWIEDDQLYMGDIAERKCRLRGIEFISLQPPILAPRLIEESEDSRLDKYLNRIAFALSHFSAFMISKQKTLLVPSFKYNMNKVCDDLEHKGNGLKVGIFYLGRKGVMEVLQALAILYHVVTGRKMNKSSIGYPVDFAFPVMTYARFYEEQYKNDAAKQFIEGIIRSIEGGKSDWTVFKGVEFSDFLIQKIRDDLMPYLLNISFQAFGLEKGMAAVRPDYVLSQMNGEIYAALGAASKKLDIPSVLVSHGSHVWHRDQYAARENDILARNILTGDYRYSAVQSPLAREMASHMMDDPARIVQIKPILWGRKINRSNRTEEVITIIHAGTLKLRHNRRFIYETSDEFVQGLQDLIESVAGFPRLRLILKIRPDIYELSMDTMKALLPKAENVVIEAEKPFLEVLEQGDLVVSFSSTTIEEALSNDVPVLLYGGDGRYAHIPVEPFSDTNDDVNRPVTFVRNREDLKKYLSKLDYAGAAFHVPAERFRDYRFGEEEVTDFTKWFLDLRKDRP